MQVESIALEPRLGIGERSDAQPEVITAAYSIRGSVRASACIQVELSVRIRGAVDASGKRCGVSCFRRYSWH